jgi:hypothetical protein
MEKNLLVAPRLSESSTAHGNFNIPKASLQYTPRKGELNLHKTTEFI